ncbi:7-carboxy-7-deazaguanine synthase [Thiorhodovibrio winogradskyi]|uniref:7-carboxy-7-deazaguanine synthase n=1 Tax=Thiorhodovibrio winogradskyi TaxID=77007 RepID=A0ABZ0S5P6_9GAMM|nr:7-carboxy-7-deazaguanine synthase [Thiorhodovibrio winogradskyi]
MAYSIHEMFHSLQGEGARSGRSALFCRFAGCNLWSGREQDRALAICRFCDTEFRGTHGRGGGVFASAAALADHLHSIWQSETGGDGRPYIVCTGGEPLLQLDGPLMDALHARGSEIAVETNGTIEPPAGIDWLCVSPKAGAPLVVTRGDELKLVFPQPGLTPEVLDAFARLEFHEFFLQPCDGPERAANITAALTYCKAHPRWRLSLQLHKLLGIR